MAGRDTQDARHREVVRAYYESGQETLLGPMLTDLRPRLVDFLRGKGLRDASLVDDLVQETLTQVVVSLRSQQYGFTGSVASWALGIGWHCFASMTRIKKHWCAQPGADDNPFRLLADTLTVPATLLPDTQEEEARAATVVAAATHAVLGLDPNARACVLLHYYQGLSVPAAAAQLGIDAATFRARLRRGLADLRNWGQHHRHLAPEPAVYDALPRVQSGDLFREPLCLAA